MKVTDLLIPLPQSIIHGRGALVLTEEMTGWASEDLTLQSKVPSFCRVLHAQSSESQGYGLEITEQNICITGFCFYALQTLRQIILAARWLKLPDLPCMAVRDRPVFPVRSAMLDVSRCRVPTLARLKETIRRLSGLKYNEVQIYLEHTFAYRDHETVWKDSSPLTADEIRELDIFCRDRNMELVPNQNAFGHMERWLRHDLYKPMAECPDGFIDDWGVRRPGGSTLNPENPDIKPFVRGLFDELLPCFTSDKVNIGMDEPWELGQGESRKTEPDKTDGELYLDFLIWLDQEMKHRGKKVQYWADIVLKHSELLPRLPKNSLVLNWGYEADHPFADETLALSSTGLPFMVCAGTSSWNSLGGRWRNMCDNIRNAAFYGKLNGASGFMITDWGDNGHLQQPVMSWPGYFMGAAAGWSGADAAVQAESMLPELLDLFLFNQKGPGLVLRESGLLCHAFPEKFHNASPYGAAVLHPRYPYYREDLKNMSPFSSDDLLKPLLLSVDAVEGEVPEEVRFTADIVIWSVKYLQNGLSESEKGFSPDNMNAGKREESIQSLTALMNRFETLWLTSSRPGGLTESAGWLEDLRSSIMN